MTKRRHLPPGSHRSQIRKRSPAVSSRGSPRRPGVLRRTGQCGRSGQRKPLARVNRSSLVGNQTDGRLSGWQPELARGGNGEPSMSVVLSDILLFSCLAAFVTGIVIAVANLLS